MENRFWGIDVSRWQGNIDWAAVKKAGVEFVMVRAGFCGYDGAVTEDKLFAANIKGAVEAGLDTGVYLYSYARTADAARKAAGEVAAMLTGYRLTYPVAFDIEDAVNTAMSKADNTAIALAFLSETEAAGYCPALYTYKSFAENNLDMAQLADYDFWLSHVTAQTNYKGAYTMWQYSWTGSVPGITGNVDLNYSYKDYPAYIKAEGLNGHEGTGEDTGEGAEPPRETPDPAPAPEPEKPQETTYVVVAGDNLTRIAQRAGVSLQALLQANPEIRNPNLIFVGQKVRIPAKG